MNNQRVIVWAALDLKNAAHCGWVGGVRPQSVDRLRWKGDRSTCLEQGGGGLYVIAPLGVTVKTHGLWLVNLVSDAALRMTRHPGRGNARDQSESRKRPT